MFAKLLIEHKLKNHLAKHPSTQYNPLVAFLQGPPEVSSDQVTAVADLGIYKGGFQFRRWTYPLHRRRKDATVGGAQNLW